MLIPDPHVGGWYRFVVLGCTHYPFLRPAIERIVGPEVSVIDPAPAIARQTGRVLTRQGSLRQDRAGQVTYFTSGDPLTFQAQVHRLAGIPGQVQGVRWEAGSIVMAEGAA